MIKYYELIQAPDTERTEADLEWIEAENPGEVEIVYVQRIICSTADAANQVEEALQRLVNRRNRELAHVEAYAQ